MADDPPLLEERHFDLHNGELEEAGSWVYVWMRRGSAEPVIYVGATRLPPLVRAWLHLHHDDPHVGRVRVKRPDALQGEVTVVAFRLEASLDRGVVKNAVIAMLAADTTADRGTAESTAADSIIERITAIASP